MNFYKLYLFVVIIFYFLFYNILKFYKVYFIFCFLNFIRNKFYFQIVYKKNIFENIIQKYTFL